MKKYPNKLKYTTLVIALLFGFFMKSHQVQADFVPYPYDVPYVVSGDPLPPNSNAGADKSVCLPATSVTVTDAIASDADGTIASAWWTFLGGTSVSTPTISPISSGPGASPMTIPDTTISGMNDVGTYDFKLTVMDNDGTLAEDTMIVTVSPAGGCALEPDLVISVDPAPSSSPVTSGQLANIVAQVTNQGGSSSGVGFTNLFQFDNDADHSSVTASDTGISGILGAGSTTSITTSYTFATAGTWYLRACADLDEDFVPANGVILESDEDNCGNWVSITVQDPNAPVVTLTASPTSGTVNVVNPGLTWGATNSPTECEASDDWSGNPGTSGNDVSQGVLTSVRTYTYTIRCMNLSAGWGPTDSATVVVSSAGVVNGQCSPTVIYGCSAGSPADQQQSGTDPYTWTCVGSGSGHTDDYCSAPYVALKKQCEDGNDNDGDGLIDNLDPGCHTDGKVDPTDPNITYDPLDDKEKNIKPIWIEI